MTGLLAQQHANTPGATATILPPLQQQQAQAQVQAQAQPPQWGAQTPTAMQGVEFGGMRPYEHSHR